MELGVLRYWIWISLVMLQYHNKNCVFWEKEPNLRHIIMGSTCYQCPNQRQHYTNWIVFTICYIRYHCIMDTTCYRYSNLHSRCCIDRCIAVWLCISLIPSRIYLSLMEVYVVPVLGFSLFGWLTWKLCLIYWTSFLLWFFRWEAQEEVLGMLWAVLMPNPLTMG